MDKILHGIIEEFGYSYSRFGHSDLMGRVVGLLICTEKPMNADDICAALEVSKSPINAICKRLEELQLVRKAWVKGGRKFHYIVVDNPFLQATENLSSMNRGNLELTERHLKRIIKKMDEATPEEMEQLQLIAQRLVLMREFYKRLLASYNRFIEEWRDARENLPDLDAIRGEFSMELHSK